jgi:Bacterial RNA polymerase, alpha chain C terminal domain
MTSAIRTYKLDATKLTLKIEHGELLDRTINALSSGSRPTITWGDLCLWTESELLRLPNFGRKALNDINQALTKRNLTLGMNHTDFREIVENSRTLAILRGPARIPHFETALDMIQELRTRGFGDRAWVVALYQLWHPAE